MPNKQKWVVENREQRRAQQRAWYLNNSSRISAENKARGTERIMANKAYYDKHPDKLFARSLKYNHGIAVIEYEQMHKQQDGKCAICNEVDARSENPRTFKGLLHVDHCHETGKIRGLLCKMCNLMIGQSRDCPTTLISAATYLKERGGGDSEH